MTVDPELVLGVEHPPGDLVKLGQVLRRQGTSYLTDHVIDLDGRQDGAYASLRMPGKTFGDEIRRARQRLGLSLRELGEKLKKPDGTTFSPQYLNDIEHGRRNPPDEVIIRQLAKALDLDAQTLLAMAGKEPEEVREYLAAMPEEREVIGRLFRKAREKKFKDWSMIESAMDGEKKPR